MPNTVTITEALQEIKTIGARLEKKRAALMQYIARDARIRDPFEAGGGSAKYVKEERQSIVDLEERIVKIRTAIQRSNLACTLTLETHSWSVSEWLTWRREIAEHQKMFLSALAQGIKKLRETVTQHGGRLLTQTPTEVGAPNAVPDVVVNIDEMSVLKSSDELEELLGMLDGKLSLFNATTTIEI